MAWLHKPIGCAFGLSLFLLLLATSRDHADPLFETKKHSLTGRKGTPLVSCWLAGNGDSLFQPISTIHATLLCHLLRWHNHWCCYSRESIKKKHCTRPGTQWATHNHSTVSHCHLVEKEKRTDRCTTVLCKI